MQYYKLRNIIFLISILMSIGFSPSPPIQSDDALEILEAMSPAERVGQLFIVSVNGASLDSSDPIFDLIKLRYISGVLLSKDNNNFSDAPGTLLNAQSLISMLQEAKYEALDLSSPLDDVEVERSTQKYVPLFIGLEYDGGQHGTLEIMDGLSPMASNMAIGATWDETLAYLSGEILGRELEALGFNLLLGPSLDVLEDPEITGSGDLGVRTFGGDPYWVSVMGESFISGIQSGAEGGMAVVATHFPGLGGSDRPIEEEVATVRKSLEELKLFDLAPFFTVTGGSGAESDTNVDGLLVSHIRYQGFQGNIRATTRPISLDPQAFELVMSLEPFMEWRLNGGITVSDSLGSRAIRQFRDPSGQSFNASLVARDAFLAGNDLLLLENFRDSNDPDEYTTITSTLDFFRNKYSEDPLFAQRVDEAVLRILRLKLKLYRGNFTTSRVLQSTNTFDDIGNSPQIVSRIAQSGATLITPAQTEIEDRVGGIPRIGERIVFLTDVRQVHQCRSCDVKTLLQADSLENAVVKLYGPGAAGQVGGWNLLSYSFADLANYLGQRSSEPITVPLASEEELDEAIRFADWLVFSLMDSRSSAYGADALQIFLDQRPDLAREKNVVVFSYDVPYGLDATEISKVDLYYALYDSGPAFIDMAAKLLFFEQSAPGASPVNIPGLGYDLIEITSPDPDQIITLRLSTPASEGVATEEPVGFMIGDTVTINTGVIVDSNGHPVPDRTPVQFLITSTTEGVAPSMIEASTQRGVATAPLLLERAGLLIITAQAERARVSETLQLNAQLDTPAQAIIISPTLIPTVTSEPTETPQTSTPTPATDGSIPSAIDGTIASRLGALVLGFIAVGIASSVGYYSSTRLGELKAARLRYTLLPAIAGLLAYNYLALDLPGSEALVTRLGGLSVLVIVLFGGAVGLLGAFIWNRQISP